MLLCLVSHASDELQAAACTAVATTTVLLTQQLLGELALLDLQIIADTTPPGSVTGSI